MPKSESQQIDELYRELARKTHPDKNPGANSADDFAEATNAFQQRSLARLLILARKYKIKGYSR